MERSTRAFVRLGQENRAIRGGRAPSSYANLVYNGFTIGEVPESIRFELVGELPPGCTAKDVMLHILFKYARPEKTINRVAASAFTGRISAYRPGMFERWLVTA